MVGQQERTSIFTQYSPTCVGFPKTCYRPRATCIGLQTTSCHGDVLNMLRARGIGGVLLPSNSKGYRLVDQYLLHLHRSSAFVPLRRGVLSSAVMTPPFPIQGYFQVHGNVSVHRCFGRSPGRFPVTCNLRPILPRLKVGVLS